MATIVVALALHDSLDLLDLWPPEPGHAATDAAVAVLHDQIRAIILGTAGLLARQPVAPLLAYEEGPRVLRRITTLGVVGTTVT